MTSGISNSLRPDAASTSVAPNGASGLNAFSHKALNATAKFWFVCAYIGQLIFVYYVLARYGGGAMAENIEALHPTGDKETGMFAVAVHLIFAVIMTVFGPLQLVPQIRARYPVFHRWNGRVFVLTAFVVSIAALYALIVRGPAAGIYNFLGFCVNAALIMVCAAMATRYALQRDFATHRRWALRLFLMASGTWLFRVGMMFWFAANQGPVGHTDAFDGPFDIIFSFAFMLIPLAVLQVYFYVQEQSGTLGRLVMASSIALLTLAMVGGTAIALIGMWIPMMA
jgi:hypothetical protein